MRRPQNSRQQNIDKKSNVAYDNPPDFKDM